MARQAQAQPNRGGRIGLACAGCGQPFVWLNGEPYTVAEVDRFAQQCARCGGYLHNSCLDEQDVRRYGGGWLENVPLCGSCAALVDWDTKFLPGVSDDPTWQ